MVSTIWAIIVMCVPSFVASPANLPMILFIDDEGALSQSQRPDQQRPSPAIQGDATTPILLRAQQETRKAASKTLRVTRWATQLDPDDPTPAPAWDDISTGYLRYRQPSNYTLSLTTHPVNIRGGNDAESRTFCWVCDGREFHVSDGEHIKRQLNPPSTTVLFEYLPLELIFCLDPHELHSRYYVSLFTERRGQATYYVITVLPRPHDDPVDPFNIMEILVDVTTLLPRHVTILTDTKGAFYEFTQCTVSDDKETITTDRVTKCNATRSAGRSCCIWNTKDRRPQRRSCGSARWHCRRTTRCRW